MKIKTLDIFCEIIDNFGDIGVVYRIGKELKKQFPNCKFRVFMNRTQEFCTINKKATNIQYQIINNIEYLTFDYINNSDIIPADIIIEAFGCTIPQKYMKKAIYDSTLLINLEYLSAEDWIEDFHLKSSPIGHGKLKKIFFMPGFTEKTGGIIADSNYLELVNRVNNNIDFYKKKYLFEKYGISNYNEKIIGTIFSYEKSFEPLLKSLKKLNKNSVLLIFGEQSIESFKNFFKKNSIQVLGNLIKYDKIEIRFLDFLNQNDYEELINTVDFNFVRGEDSFIRGILSGKPYLWHIYCQEEYVHMDKITSFLQKFERTLNNTNDYEFYSNLKSIFIDYNFRKENNYEIGNENLDFFFNNLEKIKKLNSDFRDFLVSKCNLINKLKQFLIEY